jgi:hypothetical protein
MAISTPLSLIVASQIDIDAAEVAAVIGARPDVLKHPALSPDHVSD